MFAVDIKLKLPRYLLFIYKWENEFNFHSHITQYPSSKKESISVSKN